MPHSWKNVLNTTELNGTVCMITFCTVCKIHYLNHIIHYLNSLIVILSQLVHRLFRPVIITSFHSTALLHFNQVEDRKLILLAVYKQPMSCLQAEHSSRFMHENVYKIMLSIIIIIINTVILFLVQMSVV